jgi:hypothetical protein
MGLVITWINITHLHTANVVGMGWFLEAGAEETWRKLQLLHRCEIYVCAAAAALGLGRGTYLSPFVQRGKMVDHYPTVDLVSDRTWLWTVQLLGYLKSRAGHAIIELYYYLFYLYLQHRPSPFIWTMFWRNWSYRELSIFSTDRLHPNYGLNANTFTSSKQEKRESSQSSCSSHHLRRDACPGNRQSPPFDGKINSNYVIIVTCCYFGLLSCKNVEL